MATIFPFHDRASDVRSTFARADEGRSWLIEACLVGTVIWALIWFWWS